MLPWSVHPLASFHAAYWILGQGCPFGTLSSVNFIKLRFYVLLGTLYSIFVSSSLFSSTLSWKGFWKRFCGIMIATNAGFVGLPSEVPNRLSEWGMIVRGLESCKLLDSVRLKFWWCGFSLVRLNENRTSIIMVSAWSEGITSKILRLKV